MRYRVMYPKASGDTSKPFDPSRMTFKDQASLYEHFHEPTEGDDGKLTELAAKAAVRRVYPDAVAIPMPVTVGNGTLWLLGLVDGRAREGFVEGQPIPCVAFVHAISDNDTERMQLRKGRLTPFREETWKLSPVIPDKGVLLPVEIRATDARMPIFTQAFVGIRRGGRGELVLYSKAHGIELSIAFQQDSLVVQQDLQSLFNQSRDG